MLRSAKWSLAVLVSLVPAVTPLVRAGVPQDPTTPDRRVAAALELWRRDEPKARLDALRRLKRLGPRAASAVPALVRGLSDREPRVRKATADVLHQIGPEAHPAVPALVAALADADRDVRTAAAYALVTTRPGPEILPSLTAHLRLPPERRCLQAIYSLQSLGAPAVPLLIELLHDREPSVRYVAGYTLAGIGPAARSSIPDLIETLRLPDRAARESVAKTLAVAGPEAVKPVIRALRERDPKVRGGAAFALETMGGKAGEAVPTLIAALSDPEPPDDPCTRRGPSFDDWVRGDEPRPSAYEAALRAIGPAAVPALLKQLDRPDRQAQAIAVRALGFLDSDYTYAVVPRLIALLGVRDLRLEAASALGCLRARKAVPPLIAGLKDSDPAFRARAAETLGRIGWERQMAQYSAWTTTRGAIAPLAAALKDPDPRVRAAAARALTDIGSEAAVATPDLIAAMGDPAASVRAAALRAFPRVGPVPGTAIGIVVRLLQDPDSAVRQAAARAIGDEELDRAAVIDGLLAALEDPDAEVRAAAARQLARTNGKQGLALEMNAVENGYGKSAALAASPRAGRALRAALSDPEPRVRAAAAYALPVVCGEATATVPLLSARLKDADVRVRIAAAVALAQFGAEARVALPDLIAALDEREGIHINNFSVASKAAQALRAIGPEAEVMMFDRLRAMLGSPDAKVREHAAEVSSGLGPALVPRLVQLLNDPTTARVVRTEVLHVLAEECDRGALAHEESPQARGAVLRASTSALRELAHDEEADVRRDARILLSLVEPASEATARRLTDAIREGELTDWDADEALSALEPEHAGTLISGLSDPDDEVRTASAYALAALAEALPRPGEPPDAEKLSPAEAAAHAQGLRVRSQATDALQHALKDPDTQVRWAAAWGLYVFGTDDRSITALIEMARDRTTRLRPGARLRLASTLGGGNGNYCGSGSNGGKLCVAAIQALGGFGDRAAPAVPVLIEALADDDAQTRSIAADVLGEIGPKAKEAVPALIRLLRSKGEASSASCSTGICVLSARRERLSVPAARALGKIGPNARAAVAPLIEALADPDGTVRYEAVEALGAIGPDAAPAVPALVRALDDRDQSRRGKAAEALGQIGAAAVPSLIEVVHRPDPELRCHAITALGGAGPVAAAAISDLVRALADPDEQIRTAAAAGLGQIGHGPEAAVAIPGLIAAQHDSDRVVRQRATAALGEFGTSDARIIPTLAAAMRDRDRPVRFAARESLQAIGMPAFAALRALLREDDHEVRDDAALVLARIADPEHKCSENETDEQARGRVKAPRAALLAALKEPDERIRAGASYALGFLGRDLVPELIKTLDDHSPLVRVQAARAMEVIGTGAKAALDTLRARLADPDPEVRRGAATAIDAILKPDP